MRKSRSHRKKPNTCVPLRTIWGRFTSAPMCCQPLELPINSLISSPCMGFLCCMDWSYAKTTYKSCAFQKLPSGSHVSLLNAIDASIQQAIMSITKLGGYLILLQTLYILPELLIRLLGRFPFVFRLPLPFLNAFLCCLLEITGGISKMNTYPPLWVLVLLPLGGLSFILQAGSILKKCGTVHSGLSPA